MPFNVQHAEGHLRQALLAVASCGSRVRTFWHACSALFIATLATSIGAAPGSVTYTYDELGRLKSSTYEDTTQTSYSLDAAGNRTNVTNSVINGQLQFSASTYSVTEGTASLTITVNRSGGAAGAVSVNYATANATATAGSDYTATSGTLNWTAGDTAAKTFSVPILNGTVFEAAETFTVSLSAPGGGATLGTPNSATVTVNDNDTAPSFAIANVSVSEGVAGGNVTLTVTKTGSTALSHAVSYGTSNGTATAGSDYTTTSGTLTFAAADTTKTFTVPILNNTIFELSEAFTASISAPTNGATISTANATVTITDNDTAPSFSIANVSVSENGGSVTLTVTKSGSTSLSHAVNYATANGTATAASDYTATSGTLTFATADTSKTFTVPILNNNTVYEGSETFTANLSSATNGATISTATGTVTITEDDTPPSFSIANVSVNEGGGTVTLTVTKSGSTSISHAVSYATANATATAGSDYTATSGSLTFLAADTSKTFTVSVTNDTVYEGNETFAANLSSPTNGATISTGSATVTITDNDTAPSFSVANVSVNEGGGTATLTVTKSGSSALTHAVNYGTANGTAAAGSDYTTSSGTVTFLAADTSKTFTVPITNDTVYEGNETFTASLSSPTNGATIGTGTATVTITENDTAPSFSIANVSVSESGGSVTLTVTKSGSTSLSHAVNYGTANGTAAAGSDYTTTSGTLTFLSADTSKTFTVTIGSDTVYEGNETFAANLSSPTAGATIGTGSATVTINDDDAGPVFSIANVSVNENGGSVTLTVTKSGSTALSHAVNYGTADSSAVAGSDYTATSGTLTFASADTAKTFTVSITNDGVFEGNEAFSANLGSPTNGATISGGSASVTILEDDAGPAFTIADVQVNENVGTATITVTKSGGTTLTHNVSYQTGSGTATAGVDYTAASGTLSFASNETAKTFTVSIVDDTSLENIETIPLSLSSPSNGAVLGSPSTATLSILDNDLPNVTISETHVETIHAHFVTATFRLTSGGDIWGSQSNDDNEVDIGDWLSPKTTSGGAFDAFATPNGGACQTGTMNAWINLGLGAVWQAKTPGGFGATQTCAFVLQIRNTATQVVVGSAQIVIVAVSNSP